MITDEFLKNVHAATNGRELSKDELQCAYLLGYIHTLLEDDFNHPESWKADNELVAYVATKLIESTAKIFDDIAAAQDEDIRRATKGNPLNG